MSNTIVLNTLTGAVTEYTSHDFDSVTPTHAGSALGLYAFGGNLDVTAPINSTVISGKKQWGSSLKKYLDIVFLGIKGSGTAKCLVLGENTSYSYNFTIEKDGESRCKPGRGIRENYLAVGMSNVAGGDFQLDRIEADVGTSGTRRTQ